MYKASGLIIASYALIWKFLEVLKDGYYLAGLIFKGNNDFIFGLLKKSVLDFMG